MSRILVLGGAGMLGHKMFQVLGARFPDTLCSLAGSGIDPTLEATGLYSRNRVVLDLDVMDLGQLKRVLEQDKPEVLVNCVGVIKQRPEAHDPVLSISINSLLPHLLAEYCKPWGGRVIHFSTDCVFSGREGGYTEDSISDAEDLYGRSKYLGEVKRDNALTLRTSIIGHELKRFTSLLEWFLAQQGSVISGYRRVIYSGVTTNYLAKVVGDLIESHPGLSGLYQVASRPINKYDLLCLIRGSFGIDVAIEPEDITESDRSMAGDRFEAATGLETPSWPDLVDELAAEFSRYQAWRQT